MKEGFIILGFFTILSCSNINNSLYKHYGIKEWKFKIPSGKRIYIKKIPASDLSVDEFKKYQGNFKIPNTRIMISKVWSSDRTELLVSVKQPDGELIHSLQRIDDCGIRYVPGDILTDGKDFLFMRCRTLEKVENTNKVEEVDQYYIVCEVRDI